MKLLALPTLALTCAALVFSTASADAKPKHKKHHDDDHDRDDHHNKGHHYDEHHGRTTVRHYTTSYGGERRGYYGESGLYHDGYREDSSRRHHSSGHDRRVVVYENRSYGYNYYDLQTVLQRDGYYNGPLDGDWGPGSRAALVRCQRDRGWHDDGVIDGQLIVNLGIGL